MTENENKLIEMREIIAKELDDARTNVKHFNMIMSEKISIFKEALKDLHKGELKDYIISLRIKILELQYAYDMKEKDIIEDFASKLTEKYKDSTYDISGTDCAEEWLGRIVLEYYDKLQKGE